MSITRHLGFNAFGLVAAAATAAAIAPDARANIRITEFMYSGTGGEFVELTNVSASPVDMNSWSYSDNSRSPNAFDLSAFGIVQPGESVVFSEDAESVFRTAWSVPIGVDVIGGNTVNLGRSDEINIYDASDALVDRLTFGDQVFAGTIRTQNASGWTTPDNLEDDAIDAGWVLSTIGDAQGSYASTNGDIGNPGTYVVPEPSALVGCVGALALVRRRRCK